MSTEVAEEESLVVLLEGDVCDRSTRLESRYPCSLGRNPLRKLECRLDRRISTGTGRETITVHSGDQKLQESYESFKALRKDIDLLRCHVEHACGICVNRLLLTL